MSCIGGSPTERIDHVDHLRACCSVLAFWRHAFVTAVYITSAHCIYTVWEFPALRFCINLKYRNFSILLQSRANIGRRSDAAQRFRNGVTSYWKSTTDLSFVWHVGRGQQAHNSLLKRLGFSPIFPHLWRQGAHFVVCQLKCRETQVLAPFSCELHMEHDQKTPEGLYMG